MFDDSEWMRLLARGKLREAELQAFVAKGERAVRLPAGWDTSPVVLLVHRDCANAGGWRVTRFDATGTEAEGHTEHATFEAAVRETRVWNARLQEGEEV